jgi:hypothetical protein
MVECRWRVPFFFGMKIFKLIAKDEIGCSFMNGSGSAEAFLSIIGIWVGILEAHFFLLFKDAQFFILFFALFPTTSTSRQLEQFWDIVIKSQEF